MYKTTSYFLINVIHDAISNDKARAKWVRSQRALRTPSSRSKGKEHRNAQQMGKNLIVDWTGVGAVALFLSVSGLPFVRFLL